MIVSRTTRLPRKKISLALLDGLCVAGALVASVVLRLGWDDGWKYLQNRSVSMGLVWSAFMIAFYIGGLYENDRLQRTGRSVASAFLSVSLATLLVATVFYATLSAGIGRGIFLGLASFVFVAVTALRLTFLTAARHGFMAQRSLVIGTNGEARKVIELVHQHPQAGLKVFGLIHCGKNRDKIGDFFENYPVLGTIDVLEKFVDLYDIDRLILAATAEEEPLLLRRLRSFRYRGLALIDFVSLHEELAQEIPIDYINDEWLFMAATNNSRFHIRRLKRVTDILSALIVLVLGLIPLAIGALLVKLTSRGPVLFRQERLGRDSKPFTLLKLRTMYDDAEHRTGPMWSIDNDPRVTPVGRWLRKFRIDELPQLVNVLRGEMSLVGPRPEREVFIQKLSEQIPFYAERLLVPPGITGWAQVMAPYASSIDDSRAKLQFDLYYIKHMSFFLDVYVFAKTFKTICFGRERSRKRQKQTHAATPEQSVAHPSPAEAAHDSAATARGLHPA